MLACGTIRHNRFGIPKNVNTDQLDVGNFGWMVSNTGISGVKRNVKTPKTTNGYNNLKEA